jgi:cation diffusion facilitator CzcD-associated flavoprotein CzcO
MRRITTVVVGAGHAGLAMSRCLAERSIDHVVLERGEVANTWRTERAYGLVPAPPAHRGRAAPGLHGLRQAAFGVTSLVATGTLR